MVSSHKEPVAAPRPHAAASTHTPSSTSAKPAKPALDDRSQRLKALYRSQLASLRDIFDTWSEPDLLAILDETQGDLDVAVSRISEGLAEQWGEVKTSKKKDRPKSQQLPSNSSGFVDRERPVSQRPASGVSAKQSFQQQSDTDRSRGAPAARGGFRGGRGGGRGGSRGGLRGEGRPQGGDRPVSGQFQNGGDSAQSWASKVAADTTKPTDGGWGSADSADTAAPAEASGAWDASEPAAPAATASTEGWGVGWGEPAAPAPEPKSEKKASAPVVSAPATAAKAPQPKTSWAQLVKGRPEPAPVAVPVVQAAASSAEQPSKQTRRAKSKSPARSQKDEAAPAIAPAAVPAPAPATTSTNSTAQASGRASPVLDSAKPVAVPSSVKSSNASPTLKSQPRSAQSSPVPAEAVLPAAAVPSEHAVPAQAQSSPVASTAVPPGLKQQQQQQQARGQAARKLRQDQAVVMPSNATLGSIGVQFGSLKIGNVDESADATTAFGSVAAAAPEKAPPVQRSPSPVQNQQPARAAPAVSPTQTASAPAAKPAVSETVQPAPIGLQQQQQIPSAVSGIAAGAPGLPNLHPYGSYFPNQQATAFGMAHLGGVHDYNLYGTEQARAAAMGYYPHAIDPSTYASAQGSKYPQDTLGASSQAGPQLGGLQQPALGAAQATQPSLQNQAQQAQAGFHVPYPYYPYYLPNQYQAAYQSGNIYGQQYVNKSVYPNFAQPSPSSAPAAGGPAGGVGALNAQAAAGQQVGKPAGLMQPGSTAPAGLGGSLAGAGAPGSGNTAGAYAYSTPSGQPFYPSYDEITNVNLGNIPMDYNKGMSSAYSVQQNFGGFTGHIGGSGKTTDYKQQNRQSRQPYDSQKYGQQQGQQQQQQQGGQAGQQQGQNAGQQQGQQPQASMAGAGQGQAGNQGAASHQGAAQTHGVPATGYYGQHHQFQGVHPGYQPHLMHQQYPGNAGYTAAAGGTNGQQQQRQGYWNGQN
ncbi:hypothetical protein BC831DRAFT_467744 [Entophlyctis helioformis]|nr:hypothetical protein BC831DRAFT_467744 [Entophlyctis helioformis]